MKILVTGASGYIGSHLVKKLRVCHTLDIIGDPDFNIDIRGQFHLEEEYDVVIHLAAKVRVGESVANPVLYYDTNINGTVNVLKNIKTKNFIFASTGAVEYMNCPYAISKKAGEEIVEQHCQQHNIPYTIFRFYNVIGSDGIKPTNPDGLFSALIQAIDSGVFTINGIDYNTPDGTCVRDYVHVNEICDAIIHAISSPANGIENLGHGSGRSVREIVDTFKKVNSVNFKVVDGKRRAGDIEISVLGNPSSYIKSTYTIQEILKL